MNYKEIKDLGFKEEIIEDSVYYNKFGYDYAIISIKLYKGLSIHWHKDSQTADLMLCDKRSNVINKRNLSDEEIIDFIEFFKPKQN